MNERTLEMLAGRLERLERQNRRLRLGALGVLLAVGALVLMGASASPKVIEAERFVLVDEEGRQRAVLETSAWASALSLYDGAGNRGVTLRLGGLAFVDQRGRDQLTLCGNGMMLLDAKGMVVDQWPPAARIHLLEGRR